MRALKDCVLNRLVLQRLAEERCATDHLARPALAPVAVAVLALLVALAALPSFAQEGVFDPKVDKRLAKALDAVDHQTSPIVLDARIDLICFPPEAGQPPPCTLPVGLDPSHVAPNASGKARIRVRENDTATVAIELEGLNPGMVVTAFWTFARPDLPAPAAIFEPIGPGLPPIAGSTSPVAPTGAAYSEGLGWEPNRLKIRRNGRALFATRLDYNPLKANQAPLRNGMVEVNQGVAPAGSEAEQPPCCPDAVIAPGSRPQPIGASFLRRFDPVTGFQILDAEGRPELVRSPVGVLAILIFVHIDDTTHGVHPGIPIPPMPGLPASAGDHYIMGLFPLGNLRME